MSKIEKQKAPTVIIDPTVLGDRLPRDRDSIAKKVEDTKNFRARTQRAGDQDLFTDQERASVNYIEPFEFIRRLKKLNDGLLFGWGGVPGCVSIWVLALDDEPASPKFGKLVEMPIACGFSIKSPLPEFSWLETDKWDIATKEGERGWRTVLIRLIKGGFLKYNAVKAEFGDPTDMTRGKAWYEQLREFRA